MVLKKDLERRYKLKKQESYKITKRLKRKKKKNKKLQLSISKN